MAGAEIRAGIEVISVIGGLLGIVGFGLDNFGSKNPMPRASRLPSVWTDKLRMVVPFPRLVVIYLISASSTTSASL